jgi:hypothetical protein
MNAAELAQVIQQNGRPLVEGLFAELRSNLGTSHYHRLSNDELLRRGQAIYLRLADWLTTPNPKPIHQFGLELGTRRFSEGIPLGQVILALILEEKHLWWYLEQIGQATDSALREQAGEFFARTIYGTAIGYEQALAESNRRANRVISPPKPPSPSEAAAQAAEEKQVLEISRGGEVGEHGG